MDRTLWTVLCGPYFVDRTLCTVLCGSHSQSIFSDEISNTCFVFVKKVVQVIELSSSSAENDKHDLSDGDECAKIKESSGEIRTFLDAIYNLHGDKPNAPMSFKHKTEKPEGFIFIPSDENKDSAKFDGNCPFEWVSEDDYRIGIEELGDSEGCQGFGNEEFKVYVEVSRFFISRCDERAEG